MPAARRTEPSCPLSRQQVIDRYFLEHRQKVIDLAAFLDRLERAAPSHSEANNDPRIAALHRALDILRDGKPQRARRVLESLSDMTTEPIGSAQGLGPTRGAPNANPEP